MRIHFLWEKQLKIIQHSDSACSQITAREQGEWRGGPFFYHLITNICSKSKRFNRTDYGWPLAIKGGTTITGTGIIVIISVFYSNKCHKMIVTISMVTDLGPRQKSHNILFLQE